MELVLARISRAIGQGEKIRVFGDYDCDGVTSAAILFRALASAARRSAASVRGELPSRDDGYGLRADVIDRAAANDGVTLLIAVDCGSNDLDLVARGRGTRPRYRRDRSPSDRRRNPGRTLRSSIPSAMLRRICAIMTAAGIRLSRRSLPRP